MTSEGKHDTILMVGFICYDLLFSSPHYPEEDTLVRAIDYHKRRGGNASNSCTVLSQLGAKCEVLGTFASDDYAKFLQEDLKKDGIIFSHCAIHSKFETPFTNIILSRSSGTRTILHYRSKDYIENTAEDFAKLDLSDYKWIHFEGRTIPETLKMIDLLEAWNRNSKNPIKYSVELEKCIESTKCLLTKGSVVFVAKEFAKYLGYDNPHSALIGLASQVNPGAVIIVPWGEQGSMARCSDGTIVKAKAYPPEVVLDSTGAGDTYIAATVFSLSNGKSVSEAIDFGNEIAGAKCGMMGYRGLNAVYEKIRNRK
ncbi:ketohexokinase-like [Thrips palmi]|uniref:Ketohexokinase-like n=1 Tax=Thrips palmi TaxID=161013 RepID=A0A6P9A562_THRPL|nr:ketohexokinase-like [Thrips palmi]